MTAEHSLVFADLAATRRLARDLAAMLAPGDVIALAGPLGAGKTTLAREIILAACARAGVPPPDEVPSPTYTLVQTYEAGPLAIWHFDLYRLERPEEAEELAIFDAFAGAVSLIEWPDRLGPWLPGERLDIVLDLDGTGRRARIAGSGARGRALVAALSGHGL